MATAGEESKKRSLEEEAGPTEAEANKKSKGEDSETQNGSGGDAAPAVRKGVVLFSGATDWSDVGRKVNNLGKSSNTIWRPMRLAALQDEDVVGVTSGPTSAHCFALTRQGRVFAWGRNEKGQLGLGHTDDKRCPTKITALADHKVVAAAAGRNHSLFLTDDGKVFACGDNRSGQVGGSKEQIVSSPHAVVYDGPPASRVSCGAEFSVIVDSDGGLWTWGHPEHGQLGHNTEGTYLEKAGKVNFDFVFTPTKVVLFVEKDPKSKQVTPVLGVSIKEVSCGMNHCVVIDEKHRAFSWGFGGYGRLGHSDTGNELVPRLIKFFDGPRRGIISVTSGGQFNLATAEIKGTTYMWGQYNTTKEANMYPKPIPDLSGWMDVRSIGCSGKGWIVSADDAIIGAVPSPCFGELAMGENKKSSASPIEIKTLQGLFVEQVAMGLSHSLFLARPQNDREMEKLNSYEILNQSHLDS